MNAALFSENRQMRYRLDRLVDATGSGLIVWIMLNPSTADEVDNDPTIRRCIDFSRRWGFRGLTVVNLLPIRSTDPDAAMRWARATADWEPDRRNNDAVIEAACLRATRVVLAWGFRGYSASGDYYRERACELCDDVAVLGWTTNGQPKHPLYVPANTQLIHLTENPANVS